MSSTDDDDLAGVKDWWNRNGKPLLTGALLAGVVVLGWNTWHKYQNNQSQGASQLYQALLETSLTPTGQPDATKVAELAGKLKSEFGGTAYAQYGSLFVAKVAVETGKLDDAAAEVRKRAGQAGRRDPGRNFAPASGPRVGRPEQGRGCPQAT